MYIQTFGLRKTTWNNKIILNDNFVGLEFHIRTPEARGVSNVYYVYHHVIIIRSTRLKGTYTTTM